MHSYIREYTPDELVELGVAARHLLTTPAYTTVIQDLQDACAEIFYTSDPDDAQKRQDAYTLMRCYKDIEASLQQRSHIAEQIIQQREQEKLAELSGQLESDNHDDDYLD